MRRGVRRVVALAVVATAGSSPGTFAQESRKPANPATRPPAANAGAAPKTAQAAPAQAPKPAAAPAQANPKDPRMKQLLAAWEKQSAQLTTLDVELNRVDKSPAWGDEKYKGRAILRTPNQALLHFKKVDVGDDGNEKLIDYERIVCTGTEVWQYRPDVKQIFIFPLDKKNQQRALEEGPLPFLFNMKAAEAEARYEMALVNEKKGYFVISVVPRLKVDAEAFSKAFIQLNRESYLPDRIFLISPDGTSSKDFTLSEVKKNGLVNDANFKGLDPGRPWQIIRDPGEGGAQPKGVAPQVKGLAKQAPAAAKKGQAAGNRPQPAQVPRNAGAAERRPGAN